MLPASVPVGLKIPSIGGKSTNFVDLEVTDDGTLDVPGSADEVGFYTAGPTPGRFGPAVLGAHVDSESGPGIFYNLGAKPGDQIHVTREDKTRVTFVVDKVAVYPKDDFPDRSGVPQQLRQGGDPPGHLRRPIRPRQGLPRQRRRLWTPRDVSKAKQSRCRIRRSKS